ncbi:MAG TPA: hypothetical protein VGP61_11905 [Gemmatimonadales bacterium]|nr:hypothetical protein [Gemmatimonadales bacterium]
MRRRLWSGLALTAVLAAGCGNSEPAPVAGDLLVSYYQGGPEPGAMLLRVTGGPVSDVTAVGGQQVSFASPFTGTTKVVVLGSFATGDLLRIRVPDVNQATSYSVHLDQVADKTTFALIETAPYTFTVHK